MATRQSELSELEARIVRRERRIFIRTLLFSFLPVVAAAVLLWTTIEQIDTARTELRGTEEQLRGTEEQLRASREAVYHVTLGINLFHQGSYEAAVAAYDRALELDEENSYVLNLKGYSLFKAKAFDDSLAALRDAVEKEPTYAWGYFDLARVSCATGDYESAKAAIEKAVELRPELLLVMKEDGEFERLCKAVLN
jgi:tetratricopeptide (TPR) repeat protein